MLSNGGKQLHFTLSNQTQEGERSVTHGENVLL